jgi:hypothetical protein
VNPPCSEASAPFLEREEHYSPVPPTDQLPVSKPGILPVSGVGDELVCVVRVSDARFYGITGKRAWREVDLGKFGRWPHDSLATTNAPAAQ